MVVWRVCARAHDDFPPDPLDQVALPRSTTMISIFFDVFFLVEINTHLDTHTLLQRDPPPLLGWGGDAKKNGWLVAALTIDC